MARAIDTVEQGKRGAEPTGRHLRAAPGPAFWSIPTADLLKQLETTPHGLTEAEARARRRRYGANSLTPPRQTRTLSLLLSQFTSPIILILLVAAALSFFLRDPTD